MEEKNGTVETKEVKMISVEQANAQMQNVLQQANTKMQQLVSQAQQLDAMLRDKTLDHLFNVIKFIILKMIRIIMVYLEFSGKDSISVFCQ